MNNGFPPNSFPLEPSSYAGLRDNPAGVIPFPVPKSIGAAIWSSGGSQVLPWSAGTGSVFRTASWQSPIFDLQPWLRGVTELPAASGVQISSQPIWRVAWGAGGQLFVKVRGLASVAYALTGLAVVSIEDADVSNVIDVEQITTEEDITAAYFSAGKPAAIIPFFPPGNGYPVRYWRLRLRFDYYTNNGADVPLQITAAYY